MVEDVTPKKQTGREADSKQCTGFMLLSYVYEPSVCGKGAGKGQGLQHVTRHGAPSTFSPSPTADINSQPQHPFPLGVGVANQLACLTN